MVAYEVTIPVEIMAGQASTVTFTGRSPRWSDLRPEFVRGNAVFVPSLVVHHTRAVHDEAAYVWKGRKLLETKPRRAIRQGCIYLAAESPHKDEYSKCTGTPLGPLRNRETRKRILENLPRLIEKSEARLKIRLDDVDVVLGNPIQYQTSLQSLLRQPHTGLRKGIRDAVWRNLFRDQRLRDDFERRIRACEPALMILATTSGVREDLREFALTLGVRIVEVHKHPCVWSKTTDLAPAIEATA